MANRQSMEAEARDILKCALVRQACHPDNLADAIRARLAHLGGVELPEYPRQPLPEPPNFDE
jgi:plasmid stability protein